MRSAKPRHPVAAKDRQRQDKVEFLLQELDRLAEQTQDGDMAMAARILFTAREELVHWAVTLRFYESAEDRFINRRLYAVRAKH